MRLDTAERKGGAIGVQKKRVRDSSERIIPEKNQAKKNHKSRKDLNCFVSTR